VIDQGIGVVPCFRGSVAVVPAATTTYTLTAYREFPGPSKEWRVTVTVTPPAVSRRP
jgi:hypothetical protein